MSDKAQGTGKAPANVKEAMAALQRERNRKAEAAKDREVLRSNKDLVAQGVKETVDDLQGQYMKLHEQYERLWKECDELTDKMKDVRGQITAQHALAREYGVKPYAGRVKLPPISALGLVRRSVTYAPPEAK